MSRRPEPKKSRPPVTSRKGGHSNQTVTSIRIPSQVPATAQACRWLVADLPPRIAANVTVDQASGCWVVSAGNGITIDKDGYARYRGQLVHRLAYVELVGEIPASRPILDHVKAAGCVWRSCVNVNSHLEPVTTRVNTLRGTSFAAVNAAKTRCDHGHEFDLFNCYYRPNGQRDCRSCIRDRVKRYRKRRRQRALAAALAPAADLGRAA